MKYFSPVLIFLSLTSVVGKSIEDPVARHDAKECGVYLCPSIPTYATTYLQNGCNGEFQEYIHKNILLKEALLPSHLDFQQQNEPGKLEEKRDLRFIGIGLFSGIVSLFIGFFYGKYDDYMKTKSKRDQYDFYEKEFDDF